MAAQAHLAVRLSLVADKQARLYLWRRHQAAMAVLLKTETSSTQMVAQAATDNQAAHSYLQETARTAHTVAAVAQARKVGSLELHRAQAVAALTTPT